MGQTMQDMKKEEIEAIIHRISTGMIKLVYVKVYKWNELEKAEKPKK